MKNREKWIGGRFLKNQNGRYIGYHMERFSSVVYEPLIREYASGLLADVGCGDVPLYHFYRDKITDNICVDWENSPTDQSFLDHHVDLNKNMSILESDKFDTVLCTDVLEHIHEPNILFAEMVRILKPGGHLIIGVPFLYWVHGDPDDYHRYSHFMLKEYCRKHGLKVIELEAYGGFPEVLYDLFHKGYAFYNFPLPKVYYFFLENIGGHFLRTGISKRMSERSRFFFPLGYMLVAKK